MRVMLLGATAFLTACILSAFLPLSVLMALIIIFAVLTVLFSLLKKPQLKMGQIFCFFLAAAFSVYLFNILVYIKPLEKFDKKEVNLQGVVIEVPEKNLSGYSYLLKIDKINGESYRGKIRVFSENGEVMERGDIIKLSAVVETPKDTLFQKTKLTSFGKGIYLSGEATKSSEYIGKEKGTGFIYGIIDKISLFISEDLPEREGDLLSGVLINDKTKLSSYDKRVLTDAGYSHLINVSGLHMSIIASMIFTFFKILFKEKRKTAAVFTITGIVFYIVLSGFSVSAIRAGLMLILYYAAFLSSYRSDSLNSLGAAVVVILSFNPFAVYDASFLLSVFSTFGIIYLDIYFKKISEKVKSKKLKSAVSFILPSFSALIFSSPILSVLFGEINLISPASNLFLYVFITPFLTVGLIFVLFKFIGFAFVSGFLGFILRFIGKVIFFLAEVFSECSVLSVNTFSVGAKILVFLLVLWLILSLTPMKRRIRKKANISFIVIITISVSLIGSEMFFKSREAVYVISSSDQSAVISCNLGEYSILSLDGAESCRAVESFLKSRGVRRINTIYIDGNSNHKIAAAVDLSETFETKNIMVNSEKTESVLRETYGLASSFSVSNIRTVDENYIIFLGKAMETHIDKADSDEDKLEIKTNSDSSCLTIAKFAEKVYYRYNGTLISEDSERIYRLYRSEDKIQMKEVKGLGFNFG